MNYRLVESVFTSLQLYSEAPEYMVNRCILSAKNASVDDINAMLINQFPGQMHLYFSIDKVLHGKYHGDFDDLLNTLSPSGLPPHQLQLKKKLPSYSY